MILYVNYSPSYRMENSLAEVAQTQNRRRHRSRRKSSKEAWQQRRRWKNIGLWVLIGAIGAAVVAVISIYAGSVSG